MDIRIIALVAASLICSAVFVGCSCSKSKDISDEVETNQIEMEADVTLSSKVTYTTPESKYVRTTETTEATTDTAESTTYFSATSRSSVKVQYVGDPNAFHNTTQSVVQTVIVTVTAAPKTEATTEVTTLATQAMPDAQFEPQRDLTFTANDLVIRVGEIHNILSSYSESYGNISPAHGGSAAYSYQISGDLTVITEYLTDDAGVAGEVITDIVFRGDKYCTNKGIKGGSTVDDIYAAYGMEKCFFDPERNVYAYRTDDGYTMEFYTDGNYVTEIKYRMENQ